LKPAQANSSQDPISENSAKTGLSLSSNPSTAKKKKKERKRKKKRQNQDGNPRSDQVVTLIHSPL
jgi:hypothetical protein